VNNSREVSQVGSADSYPIPKNDQIHFKWECDGDIFTNALPLEFAVLEPEFMRFYNWACQTAVGAALAQISHSNEG
jgi:hypothetical protein